ncbi:MAG: menaquinone biosynthesis protein [Planctomycetota bacterium]
MKFVLGVVPYLNAKPLIVGLTDHSIVKIIFQPPSRLARSLEQDKVDAVILPVAEFFKHKNYRFIPGISISARGKGESVKLFFRGDISQLKKVYLDPDSLTSNILVRLILLKKYGLSRCPSGPVFQNRRISTLKDSNTGFVSIGDRTFKFQNKPYRSIDLAEEWFKWTGLSFVFALWVYKKGGKIGRRPAILQESKKIGLKHLQEISVKESRRLKLPQKFCLHYLTKCIKYDLGRSELAGLKKFKQLTQEMELLK